MLEINKINLKLNKMKCKNGKHDLWEIYRIWADPVSDEVVRWCKDCGAIVIDSDSDRKTNPGSVMEMKFPNITINFVKNQ